MSHLDNAAESEAVGLSLTGAAQMKFSAELRRLILPHNSLLQSAPLAPPLHSTTPFLCVLRLDLALSLLLIVHSQFGSSASALEPHASSPTHPSCIWNKSCAADNVRDTSTQNFSAIHPCCNKTIVMEQIKVGQTQKCELKVEHKSD
uniref:Uncharacterized protein n=1 Tax=Knipowitschia caucasica TaxID=637954 RepID=A0AAV2JKT4_KNICA